MDLIYNQSNKKFIQEYNEIFQTGVLSGKLDISFLVSQCYKHEAYYSQRMERIQITLRCKTDKSSFNPNRINNIIASVQNNDTKSGILREKRWKNRN